MKHLLSILILLGFVSATLISCSQPEHYIENCADYNTEEEYKSDIRKAEANIKKFNVPTDSCELDGYLWSCGFFEKIEDSEEGIDNLKSFILSAKLKDLLYYESEFRSCSESFKEDEITFKAKWK